MAVTDPLIDTLFDGRYRIVRKIGAGGMANVYLAEDQELGRRVAIKILNDRHANDEQFVERFRREAKNAAALSHPNIVSIYDRGEAEGTYYIAMEYLEGRSLKELIVGRGPAPVNVAIEYARQILSALRFAHRHGIVHRDIKPHNVLVDGEGRVKVTDFGIARAGTSQMTEAGSIVGTAQYLSPEQARGANVDQRSDLYSLGVVLYELLTGEAPFEGDTPVEVAMKHLSTIPDAPSTHRPDLPRELDLVVTRALAKDPEDRYQSAEEMDADLDRVARGAPIAAATEDSATQIMRIPPATEAAAASATMIAPPRSRPQAPVASRYYDDYEEPVRRRPIWPWLAALLFVIAAGVIGGWYVWHQLAGPSVAKVQVRSTTSTSIAEDAVAQITRSASSRSVKTEHERHDRGGTRLQAGSRRGQARRQGERRSRSGSRPASRRSTVPDVRRQVAGRRRPGAQGRGLNPDVHTVPGGTAGPGDGDRSRAAASRRSRGRRVRVNVASGPEPVIVPKVTGEPICAGDGRPARSSASTSTRPTSTTAQPAEQVIEQDPSRASKAPKNSTINVKVSNGPADGGRSRRDRGEPGPGDAGSANDGFTHIQASRWTSPTRRRTGSCSRRIRPGASRSRRRRR